MPSILADAFAEPCIAPSCLPDYPNGQAPPECLIEWRGCEFPPGFFVRLVPATLEVESDGTSVIDMGEGYRALGVPADSLLGQMPAAEFEANAGDTSTGGSNQWYQEGRAIAGYTPSAATPGTSNHGNYTVGAVDCYPNNDTAFSRRASMWPAWGISVGIPGEDWHCAGDIDPTNPLPTLAEAIAMSGATCTGPVPPRRKTRLRTGDLPKLLTSHYMGM